MQRVLSLLVFSVCVLCCTAADETLVDRPLTLSVYGPLAEETESEGVEEEAVEAVEEEVVEEEIEEEVSTEETEDPYDGYENWCENLYKTECFCAHSRETVCDPIDPATKEPKSCGLDRTGREQVCLRPQWARKQGSPYHECRPRWLSRKQQGAQRHSLRMIVDEVCKQPTWATNLAEWGEKKGMGNDPSKLCWHLKGADKALPVCTGGHFCNRKKLRKFLGIAVARESSWDNETTHVLDRDKEANKNSFNRLRSTYADSEHYRNPDRWEGYGWYGHNAALGVWYWDTKAPPEILCRQVESTEVHLRKMRRSFTKLWARYGDRKKRTYTLDTGETVEVTGVTWYDLHRAASSGKLTPEKVIKTRKWKKKEQKWKKIGFVSRARSKRVKLDPFESVLFEWLGEPIPKDTQNEEAERIRQKIRDHFKPTVAVMKKTFD